MKSGGFETYPQRFAVRFFLLRDLRNTIQKFSPSTQIFRWPVASKTGICSRQACLERSRKDAKNAKSGSLISLRPLRLCGRYSEFWLRLCNAEPFAVRFSLLLMKRKPLRRQRRGFCGRQIC